ncbi:hypothetical protein OC845_006075 [Tilletia horrida]|nr:hypothetical protein OC845_006075 [Tilletia horrida]
MAPKRKAPARSQSAAAALGSSTSAKSPPLKLPRAWQPPTAAIPPGQEFAIRPDEYYPTVYSDVVHWNAVPVFKPSWDEFKDFYTYCKRISPEGMQHGIVKIVPPKEWLAMQGDLSERLANFKIVSPLRQIVQPGGEGAYQQTNQPQADRTFTVKEWADMCASAAHRGPELKKIQDRLAERYRMLELIEASKQAKRKAKKKSEQDSPPQDQQAEASTSQLPPQDSAASSTAPQQTTETTQAAQLPTPPQSVGATSPNPEDRNANSSANAVATQVPLSTPSLEQPSEAQAQMQSQSSLSSTEAQPSSAANPSLGVDTTGTTPTKSGAPTTNASPPRPSSSSSWDYRRAWMQEYLPANLAAEAKDEDWTIDVCAEIEIEYWRSLGALRSNGASSSNNAAVKGAWYGADQCGTLFDEDMQVWNISKLDNVLTRMLGCIDENGQWRDISLDSEDEDDMPMPSKRSSKNSKTEKAAGNKKGKGKASQAPATSALDNSTASAIAGVTTPYLYFGQWQATFSWHVEDMDLCSINYIHFGAPKQWYSIPQSERNRFETAMKASFPNDSNRCKQFLRHKSYLVNPSRLASIKPLKLVQHAGEIVLTFPYGYHSGYNLGFNCAESTNFALDDWVKMGMDAQVCQCTDREQQVSIDVTQLYREAMAAQKQEDRNETDDGGEFEPEDDDHEKDGAWDSDSDDEDARSPSKAKKRKRDNTVSVKPPAPSTSRTSARRSPTKEKEAAAAAAALRAKEATVLREKEAAALRESEAAALRAENAKLQLERDRSNLQNENARLQLENERVNLQVENIRLQMENERLQLGGELGRLRTENERLKLEVRMLREKAYGKRT